MGLSENPKDSTEDPAAGAGETGSLSARAFAAQSGADAPVDLTDPIWQPIDGVTLDQYAQITAALSRQDLGRDEESQAWLEAQGVEPGTWGAVQAGWVNRMAMSEAVRTRYGILYSRS